ncbi:hypothetical protein NEUTE2DRAFT_129553 [Neurospora tetrasperma FGSC 2509]|nr:hypothetical protein NEUTE2DRAFT_129553 [Neurospora tetrasperma FGSC 2509]
MSPEQPRGCGDSVPSGPSKAGGLGCFMDKLRRWKARLLGQASSDDNPGRAPPSQNPNQVCNKDVSGLVKQ